MNIIINGLYGKMGQTIVNKGLEKGVKIVAGIDPRGKKDGETIPVFHEIKECTIPAEGLIDFSVPAALENLLTFALEKQLPLVLATTGYSEEDLKKIQEASKKIPILQSYNMSLGIAVLKALTVQAGKILGNEFDIEIVETHHHHKVDAPSGTAILLYEALKKEVNQQYYGVYGRQGQIGARDKKEIGIHTLRGGNVPGTHEVHFFGENQNLTLSHQANDRSIFALGALDAIKFLKEKKHGLYHLDDLVQELVK